MSSPALIVGIEAVYHAFLATTNSQSSPTPATVPGPFSWQSFAFGAAASIAGALVITLIIVGKRGLRPTVETIKSLLFLHWGLSSIKMSRFNRCRADYRGRRGGNTIAGYVSTASSTLKMVGFSLITGIQFEELVKTLRDLIQRTPPVVIDISLLDPRKKDLMRAIAPAYTLHPNAFSNVVYAAIDQLFELRNSLPPAARGNIRIHVHQAIPFGSAILIDTAQARGRIQIETKGYKSGLDLSWGFELRAGGRHELYRTLVRAYEDLIRDGEELQGPLPHSSK